MKEYKYCPFCGKNLHQKKIDGLSRAVCTDSNCGFVNWNNPTPVVAAVVQKNDKVILVRNQGWPEKVFGLITGFLEAGEKPEEGILREVKEELDLEGELVSFIGNYIFPQNNQLIIAFHVNVSGEIKISDELAEYKEISIDRVKPWPFGTGLALDDWLKNIRK